MYIVRNFDVVAATSVDHTHCKRAINAIMRMAINAIIRMAINAEIGAIM